MHEVPLVKKDPMEIVSDILHYRKDSKTDSLPLQRDCLRKDQASDLFPSIRELSQALTLFLLLISRRQRLDWPGWKRYAATASSRPPKLC